MGINVLSKTGFSGHRHSRDPLTIVMDAVQVKVAGFGKMRLWRKVPDVHQMSREQQAEYLARQMGYSSYQQCRQRVDDILPLEG